MTTFDVENTDEMIVQLDIPSTLFVSITFYRFLEKDMSHMFQIRKLLV